MAIRRPPKLDELPADQKARADAWLDEGDYAPSQPAPRPAPAPSPPEEPSLPWDAPGVDEDKKKSYLLRLPEPLHLQLKHIAQEEGWSFNALCNEVLGAFATEKLGLDPKRRAPTKRTM
jgi:hypothetical protein